jgi:prepilin-type N-terminal cleavage/methylation domain-containing protein
MPVPVRSRGFSLLEVVVAVGLLSFCLLPIITHSRQTVKETEFSQEDLIARHFLIDLVERFKGSSVEELKKLPPVESDLPLGSEPVILSRDDILAERRRVVSEMRGQSRRAGYEDAGARGLEKILDIADLMRLTRGVVFIENVGGVPGMHELTCTVRWKSRLGQGERKIGITKVLAR